MGTLARRMTVAVGVMGAVVVGQAPEFAQQYRQRIGGALDELQAIVSQFDADAARNSLSRSEALGRYRSSSDGFFRDRGRSMGEVIARFETLSAQRSRFEQESTLMRPVILLRSSDPQLLRGAWRDFRPAMPVTPDGLAWSLAGFVAGVLLTFAVARSGRAARRAVRRRPRVSTG